MIKVYLERSPAYEGYDIYIIDKYRGYKMYAFLENGYLNFEEAKESTEFKPIFRIGEDNNEFLQAFTNAISRVGIFPEKENTDKIRAEAEKELLKDEVNFLRTLLLDKLGVLVSKET